MDTLVRSIKFPLAFNVARLQEDLVKIINSEWVGHYNSQGYSGNWSSLALLSRNGKSDEIYASVEGNEKLVPTEILDSCQYFKEILDGFPFEKTAVRLLQLSAGSEVKPHSDHSLGYEDGCFRLHIPIVTNSQVEFILDGKRLVMNEGECWYIDANFTHSVANRGKEDRVHLVIDGLKNEWTDRLFYKEASEDQFVRPSNVMDAAQKQLMIEELSHMGTPAAMEILKGLKH